MRSSTGAQSISFEQARGSLPFSGPQPAQDLDPSDLRAERNPLETGEKADRRLVATKYVDQHGRVEDPRQSPLSAPHSSLARSA